MPVWFTKILFVVLSEIIPRMLALPEAPVDLIMTSRIPGNTPHRLETKFNLSTLPNVNNYCNPNV